MFSVTDDLSWHMHTRPSYGLPPQACNIRPLASTRGMVGPGKGRFGFAFVLVSSFTVFLFFLLPLSLSFMSSFIFVLL